MVLISDRTESVASSFDLRESNLDESVKVNLYNPVFRGQGHGKNGSTSVQKAK